MSVTETECTVCHRENAPWRQHCGTCGCALRPRPGACACGVHNAPEDRFCGACARPVRSPGGRTHPPRQATRHDITTKLDVLEDVIFEETPVGRAHD